MFKVIKSYGPVFFLFLIVTATGVYAMSERSLQEMKAIGSSATKIPELCVLAASASSRAVLMDLDGNVISTFLGDKLGVSRLCYSFKRHVLAPSTRYILAGDGKDENAYLWDFFGKRVATLQGHTRGISVVCFSPGGQHILTGSEDMTARLWNLQGDCEAIFPHANSILAACFSPDERHVLTGSLDGTVCLWNFSGAVEMTFQMPALQGDKNPVARVCFNPDGCYIVAGSFMDSKVCLWDLEDKSQTLFLGHTGTICSLCFSPDGQYILTGSSDGTARLWNLKGECITIISHKRCIGSSTIISHRLMISVACFDLGGERILTAAGSSVMISDLQGNYLYKHEFDGLIRSACLSPDGRMVLAACSKGVYLWDLKEQCICNIYNIFYDPLACFVFEDHPSPLAIVMGLVSHWNASRR